MDSAPDVLEAIAAVLRDAGDPSLGWSSPSSALRWKVFSVKSARTPTKRKIARHVAAFRDLYFGGTFPKALLTPHLRVA